MFESIKKFFMQQYLKIYIAKDTIYSQVLFDFNKGNYDHLVEGPGDERTEGLVHVFVDQMLHQEDNQTLILVAHTDQESGYVFAMNSNCSTMIRYFRAGWYEMAEAFSEVARYARRFHGIPDPVDSPDNP